MKKFTLIAAAFMLFASCATHNKRVLIMASSDVQVDNSQKNITVSEGTTHHEKELEFSGSDPITISVQSPSGKFNLDADGDGLFIVNLKPDTVVGSYQHTAAEADLKITQEQLAHKIDSLKQLLAGQNVSAANRNYFILPNHIAKVSSNSMAKVFGPYTSIPASFDASSAPEVYKFYTSRELREIIDKLSGMNK